MNIKESTSLLVWIHRIFDVILPIFTLYLIATSYSLPWSDKYQVLSILGGLLLLIFNQGTGAYTQFRSDNALPRFRKVVQAWIFTWLALLALAFLMKNTSAYPRIVVTGWMFTTPILLLAYRLILSFATSRFRNLGFNTRKIAILGAGSLGQRLAASVFDNKALGYNKTAGLYDDNIELIGQGIMDMPALGSIEALLKQPHLGG